MVAALPAGSKEEWRWLEASCGGGGVCRELGYDRNNVLGFVHVFYISYSRNNNATPTKKNYGRDYSQKKKNYGRELMR
jgi:hypothetical protein